jgi:hypothetical protein
MMASPGSTLRDGEEVLILPHHFFDVGEIESGGDYVGGSSATVGVFLSGGKVSVAVGGEDKGVVRKEFDGGVSTVTDIAVGGVAVVVFHPLPTGLKVRSMVKLSKL